MPRVPPKAECLAKVKARIPYEFSVKVASRRHTRACGRHAVDAKQSENGRTLAEALGPVVILSDVAAEVAIVDHGYRGVAIDGVRVRSAPRDHGWIARAMIKRCREIEPAIDYVKVDGKLGRKWLQSAGRPHACIVVWRRSQPEEAAAFYALSLIPSLA